MKYNVQVNKGGKTEINPPVWENVATFDSERAAVAFAQNCPNSDVGEVKIVMTEMTPLDRWWHQYFLKIRNLGG